MSPQQRLVRLVGLSALNWFQEVRISELNDSKHNTAYQRFVAFGSIAGAALTQFAHWSWIFWVSAFVAFPTSVVGFFLIHTTEKANGNPNVIQATKWRSLNISGVGIITGNGVVGKYRFIANDITHSCPRPLQLCCHIRITIWLGFCEGTWTAYHLNFYVGGVFLLWNKDSPVYCRHVRMNQHFDVWDNIC